MKKLLVILVVLNIGFIVFYTWIRFKYNDLNTKLEKVLEGDNSYETQVSIYKSKYDELLNNIVLVSDKEVSSIDDVSNYEEKLVNNNNDLKKKNDELVSMVNSLNDQKKVVQNTYDKLYKEEMAKRTYLISNISKINQYSVGYPTGCESAALTILLKYWGINVSIGQVVDVLPKGAQPYYEK